MQVVMNLHAKAAKEHAEDRNSESDVADSVINSNSLRTDSFRQVVVTMYKDANAFEAVELGVSV